METIPYTGAGISTDPDDLRCVNWTKQTSDKIINGQVISKSRDYLEPKISPTTRLIKDVEPGDTAFYTQGGYPDFRILDETTEDDNNVRILNDVNTAGAEAKVSTISAGSSITGFTISNAGRGYTSDPDVTVSFKQQVLELGKSWTSGVTTTVSTTDLRDIVYDNFYVVSDERGGIKLIKCCYLGKCPYLDRFKPANGRPFMVIMFGLVLDLTLMLDILQIILQTGNWISILLRILELRRYRLHHPQPQEKFTLLHMVMISLLLLEVVQAYSSQTMSIPTIQTG